MLELLSSVHLTLGRSLGITYHWSHCDVCLPANTIDDPPLEASPGTSMCFFLLSRWNTRFSALCPKASPRRKTQTCAKRSSQTPKSVCDVKKRLLQIFEELIKRFDLIAAISDFVRFFTKLFLVNENKKTTESSVIEEPLAHCEVTAHSDRTRHLQLPAWSVIPKPHEFSCKIDRHYTHVISISDFYLNLLDFDSNIQFGELFSTLNSSKKRIFVKAWQFSSLRLNLLTISRVQFQFLSNTSDLYGSNHFIRFNFISQRHQKKQSK